MFNKPKMPEGHSSKTPGIVVILIDESDSMKNPWDAYKNISKSAKVAELVNGCLRELIQLSRKGTRGAYLPRTFVAVYGYTTNETETTVLRTHAKGWPDKLAHDGGIDEIWVKPIESGRRTPIGGALEEVAQILATFYSQDGVEDRFKNSMPTLVINLTDGGQNEGISIKDGVRALKQINNQPCPWPANLFNVHISPEFKEREIIFPSTEDDLDRFGKELFRNSDVIPDALKEQARVAFPDLNWREGRRGLLVNAGPSAFVKLLRIGFDTVGQLPHLTQIDDPQP